jgi:putative nucleotidyltransferase with HDIG domain
MIYKIFLFVISIIVIVGIYPHRGKLKYEFSQGDNWKYETLHAPFSFAIEKTDSKIEKEREQIISESPKYFKQLNIKDSVLDLSFRMFDTLWIKNYGFKQREAYLNQKRIFENILAEILEKGVLKIPESDIYLSGKTIITVIDKKRASNHFVEDFVIFNDLNRQLNEYLKKEDIDYDAALFRKVLLNSLKPNIVFDAKKTNLEINERLNNLSLNQGLINEGEIIIKHNEKIDARKYIILESLKNEHELRVGSSGIGVLLGKSIIVAFPLIALILFLIFFRLDIFEDNKKLVFILLLNIIMVLIARVMVDINVKYIYITPMLLIPIIIRAFFDTRLALLVHLISILLTSFMVQNSFEFIYLQLITGIITIITVVNLQQRSQFFYTSIYIFLSYSVIYLGMTLIQEGSINNLDTDYFIYFGASAGLCLLAFPLIYFFEKLFGFITDISLMEYSDSNHKLLRELSEKAPGTFQHSLMMANIAEDAAKAIKANPLLTRVGALYHDVGKIKNPDFFTENQRGSVSPHEDLTDKESAKIIINHVIDGIEIARKHNIPEQIIDFIRTHHGTKKAIYFYRHSLSELPASEVNEDDFIYPGPIPFTKETCILMIADAVEAATRSLKKRDETSIRDIVEKIVKMQLDEGQFSNANISLRDLNIIKKVLVRKLLNINHVRIAYPE